MQVTGEQFRISGVPNTKGICTHSQALFHWLALGANKDVGLAGDTFPCL